MNLDDALDEVMASPWSRREYLAASDWLTDVDLDDVVAIEADFEARFEQALSRVRQVLGQPAYDDESDLEAVDAWYAEAIRLAAWRHRDGWVFLAVEHHDRDTPVGLLTRSTSCRLDPHPSADGAQESAPFADAGS